VGSDVIYANDVMYVGEVIYAGDVMYAKPYTASFRGAAKRRTRNP
jgi:hypothetical protein